MSSLDGVATRRAHPGLILATLCVANFIATLDLFVVNVALRDIGGDIGGSDLSNLSWILNAYAIVFGALLIPAGRFADKFGKKTTFMLGLALFSLASVACALSPSLWLLIVFRCIQAAGAAILTPASLGLVLTALPGEKVENGIRIWAVSAAFAGAAGPVIGGLLTDIGWRWIFVVNVPIGLLAILATWKFIENVNYDRGTRLPDPIGTLLLIAGVGVLSLGIVEGPSWGWDDPRVIGCWIVAALAAVAFLRSSGKASVPVVEFSMFRSSVFRAANLAALILFGATAIQLLSISYFYEQSWHWSAIQAGLAIAPGPSMVLIASFVGQKLNERFKAGSVAAVGFLMVALGQALIVVLLHHSHSYAVAILPGWMILGAGLGLAMPTAVEFATIELTAEMSATGSAVNAMARQLGGVIGTAVTVVVLAGAALTGAPGNFYTAWWIVVGLCVVGAAVALGITPRGSRSEVPAEIVPDRSPA